MPKVQESKPDQRPRSDSFLRMLELEKRFKMQRTRHAQAPTTSSPPSASLPSANANHPPVKARRLSAHPPLSHQTQIMKAVRRSSALPSLSISIPPSPTKDLDEGTGGPLANQSLGKDPAKEDRAKTVTFSDPEENEDLNLSDQSSICQSPSWEQYGQRKKKKPKKRDAGEDKKDHKGENLLKKKGNRLSKAPPHDAQGIEPLTATDRSRSAPQLESYLKPENESSSAPKSALQDKMTNHQLAAKAPTLEVNGKPKSKGFLSGFRLQHGNVSAVQKLMETSHTTADDNRPTHGGDPTSTNTLKPPSIRSAMSTSTRSNSSQDKRPPLSRYLPSSSHGRSQSLLSSTLNKLKGPSYLYYRPAEDGVDSQKKRPSSARGPDPAQEGLVAAQNSQHQEKQKEEPKAAVEPAHQPPEADSSSKPKQEPKQEPKQGANEPGPEIAPRARKSRIKAGEPRDVSSDREPPAPAKSNGRQVQSESTQTCKRDSVMAMVMAQEKQSRTDRLSQQAKPHDDTPSRSDDRIKKGRNKPQEIDTQSHGYVQTLKDLRADPKATPGMSFHERTDSQYSMKNQIDRVDGNHGGAKQEDDEISIGTHASTIRPPSRHKERTISETNNRNVLSSDSPKFSNIGRAVTTEVKEGSLEDRSRRMPGNKGAKSAPTQYPVVEPERSPDYFAFINESYAPPSLELRAPSEDRLPFLQTLEAADGGDEMEDFLRNHPLNHSTKSTSGLREQTKQVAHRIAPSHANDTSRVSSEPKPKESPSISAHYSDSDLPIFERLGISPKTARILAGFETASSSTSQSHQTEPSHGTSERSSSSTYEDAPASPSSITTPDSSRPQSRKGNVPFSADASQNTLTGPSLSHEDVVGRKSHRPPPLEPRALRDTRSIERSAKVQDDSWSRTAMPIDLDDQSTSTPTRIKELVASTSSLVASPTSVTFAANAVKEKVDEERRVHRKPDKVGLPPRAQSALDIHSTINDLPLRANHPLSTKNAKHGAAPTSLPNSPPAEHIDEIFPRKSALKLPRNNTSDSQDTPAIVSPGAAYLQEARKNAPAPPNPASRALRPQYTHKNSSGSINSAGSSDRRAEPLAKMLVECCNCKFFHDMPSRVYECMAKPDSIVEDKLLGVSAAITTMVKCPWCGHGMTTQCCSGYAAVVYLKEKLHGK
ncbi:hypothetical protein F4809DRAFT_6125 [Biscogniauxia mediterranea]|nr:hypothetical protein F4809DRAFT_6125 [Biscogniauxia mediterranea]